MPKVEVGSMDLSGGLVTARPPHQLEEGQASYILNGDPFINYGAITCRLGSRWYIRTALTDATAVASGLYQYIKADGTAIFYLVHGKSIYEVAAPATATARYTDADDLGNVNFTTFMNKCIAVGPTMPTEVSTGGAFAALAGSPPANGKYIQAHKDRVWIAGGSNGASRVSYCVLGDEEDWTTIAGADTDAGFIDIGGDDGDVITGLASLGNVMVVFKKSSTWMITGSHANNFAVRPISLLIGCIAPRSIVKADQFAIFLSDLGVYSVTANGNGVVRMSYNIQPSIDSIDRAYRTIAVAGRYKTQYWLTFKSASANSNTTYVLDYVFGSWTRYDTIRSLCYLTAQDGTLYSQPIGVYDAHDVVQHNIGYYDETDYAGTPAQTNVSFYWNSKDYDFGAFTATKQMNDVIPVAGPLASNLLTVAWYLNGDEAATVYTVSLTPTGTEDKIIGKAGVHFADTEFKNWIRYAFRGSSGDGSIIFYGYSALADVYERENG